MEDTMFISLVSSINVVFIAIVCLVTYGINDTITRFTKKELSRNFKSIVSLVVGIITACAYIKFHMASTEGVLLSFLICTFGYDLILKPMLNSFKNRFTHKE